MKALAAVVGVASLLAPLWFLSGFVTVPEHRTGTIADYSAALISGVTLYSGVFAGVGIHRYWKARRGHAVSPGEIFVAGIAGAGAAITIGLILSALGQLLSTGTIMPKGQTPALLPVLYIVGGLIGAFIAGGAALIAYGLSGPKS